MNGRRRRAVFALAAVAIGLVATTVSLFALDVYLHARAARSAGLNVWGYRGRVVGRKQPGELRVASPRTRRFRHDSNAVSTTAPQERRDIPW
jgi:hypothetical protein